MIQSTVVIYRHLVIISVVAYYIMLVLCKVLKPVLFPWGHELLVILGSCG